MNIVSVRSADGTWHELTGVKNVQVVPPVADTTSVVPIITTPTNWQMSVRIRPDSGNLLAAIRVIQQLIRGRNERTQARRLRLSRMHADYRRKKRGHR